MSDLEALRDASPGELRAALESVLGHTGIILTHKPRVDALIRGILDAPTGRAIDEVYDGYNRLFQRSLAEANFYRLCLFLLATALAGAVG